jgi:hypothetical protein
MAFDPATISDFVSGTQKRGFVASGYVQCFLENIRLVFVDCDAANPTLPVPWPWSLPFGHALVAGLRSILTGFFYIATFVFPSRRIFYV